MARIREGLIIGCKLTSKLKIGSCSDRWSSRMGSKISISSIIKR